MTSTLVVRDGTPPELAEFGRLLVRVYAALPGFPGVDEQPGYYGMLANVGAFTAKPGARVLVGLAPSGALVGGVVYFGDMAQYGSGGTATTARNASGIRLLGVDPAFRGAGAGRALTLACIDLARAQRHERVILHTTKAMQVAWALYEQLGFVRAGEFDFLQQGLPVYGFSLALDAVGAAR